MCVSDTLVIKQPQETNQVTTSAQSPEATAFSQSDTPALSQQ